MEGAAERSYGRAVEHLRTGHGIAMGKELLENVTKTVSVYGLMPARGPVVHRPGSADRSSSCE